MTKTKIDLGDELLTQRYLETKSKDCANCTSREIDTSSLHKVNSWDEAIERARYRIKRMKSSLKVFEKMKAEGHAWPQNSETTDATRN